MNKVLSTLKDMLLNKSTVISINNRVELVDFRKRIYTENKGGLYIVAGEARSEVYETIVNERKKNPNLTRNDNVICGPKIAVKNEKYKKYYESFKKREGEWWKIHPLFEAKQNQWIKLYLKQHERESKHYCYGTDQKTAYIEKTHLPMMSNGSSGLQNNRVAYQTLVRQFSNLINSDDVIEINGWGDLENVDGFDFVSEETMLNESKAIRRKNNNGKKL